MFVFLDSTLERMFLWKWQLGASGTTQLRASRSSWSALWECTQRHWEGGNDRPWLIRWGVWKRRSKIIQRLPTDENGYAKRYQKIKRKKSSMAHLLTPPALICKKNMFLHFSISNLNFHLRPHLQGNRKVHSSFKLAGERHLPLFSMIQSLEQMLSFHPPPPSWLFPKKHLGTGWWNWWDCQGSWWSHGGKVDYKAYNHINYRGLFI